MEHDPPIYLVFNAMDCVGLALGILFVVWCVEERWLRAALTMVGIGALTLLRWALL